MVQYSTILGCQGEGPREKAGKVLVGGRGGAKPFGGGGTGWVGDDTLQVPVHSVDDTARTKISGRFSRSPKGAITGFRVFDAVITPRTRCYQLVVFEGA